MNLVNRILCGYAHIGHFGYSINGTIYRWIVTSQDRKRLKKQKNYDESDIVVHKDIPYLEDKDPYHLLDVYEPKDATDDLPLVFQIHGGGLMYAKKELNRHSNCEIVRKGFRLIAISYRLAPKHTVLDILSDCLNALRWVQKNYPGKNIFYVGDSAGGYLGLLINAILKTEEFKEILGCKDLHIRCLAAAYISPMTVLDRHDMLACSGKCSYFGNALTSPLHAQLANLPQYLTKDNLVPAVITTSDKDMIREDVVSLNEIYDREGIKHVYIDETSKEKHPIEHVFPVTYPKYEESQKVYDQISQFFSLFDKPE